MQWEEGDLAIIAPKGVQAQIHYTVKGVNPTTYVHICGCDSQNTTNGETARVVSGGVGRVREGLLPQLDVGFLGVELDTSEKAFSGPRKPRL